MCVCARVSEKVSDSLIMSFCGPPLCALQSSLASDAINLGPVPLATIGARLWISFGFDQRSSAVPTFNRLVELANMTCWIVGFFSLPFQRSVSDLPDSS